MASSSPFTNSLPLCAEKISPVIRSDSAHPSSFPTRSSYATKLARLSIAAATVASLPFMSTDSVAMASTASFSDVAMESTASDLDVYTRNPSTPDIYPNPNPNINTSSSSKIDSHGHTSLAFPSRYEESVSHYAKCPKWSRSEYEMVMPDFHGPPKATPRRGHQWQAASLTLPDTRERIAIIMPPHSHDLFFLHISHLPRGQEAEEEVVVVEHTNATTIATHEEKNPSSLPLYKVWQKKVMCFTL